MKSRVYYGVVKLYVPYEKWASKLLSLGAIRIKKDKAEKDHWKAIHRGKLINRTDIEILRKYNSEVCGMANYYSLACNPVALIALFKSDEVQYAQNLCGKVSHKSIQN